MAKDIHVLLYDCDPFARNWMALLLSRDWRTKVVAEAARAADVSAALQKVGPNVDLVILNAEFASWTSEMEKISQELKRIEPPPLVLWVGRPDEWQIRDLIPFACTAGCILKEEINHSLAWAVALAGRGYFVVTPGVASFFDQNNPIVSQDIRLLDGRKSPFKLNRHELEVARMAFLFSLERRNMMDEKTWKEDRVYNQVSAIYEKLGIKDLMNGEQKPESFFEDEPVMAEHFKDMMAQASGFRKKSDETLAFHLVTMPVISKIY